jgi:hypothetical protein
MNNHFTILGALHVAYGVIILLVAAFVLISVIGGGYLSNNPEIIGITTGIGSVVGLLLAILAIPGIIGGFGLIYRKHWARPVLLIVGCAHLLNVPFGTALGVYTFWALMQPEARLI